MRKGYTFVLAAMLAMGSAVSYGQQVIFVTENNSIGIITNVDNPTLASPTVAITGLGTGQNIEGIDFRPRTGQLYALGHNPNTQETQLYTLTASGTAVAVNSTPLILSLVPGQIGFDFNPVADRIRITSSNGSNYRLDPNNGALAGTDAVIEYDSADVNDGQTPMLVASAYSKSYIGTENTVLYGVDYGLNTLVKQDLGTHTLTTIGDLDITINPTNPTVGFDLFYNPQTQTEEAYLAANTSGANDNLYTVNLGTGEVTSNGQIGLLGNAVRDIAVVIDRTLEPITGIEIFALTENGGGVGNLIRFDSDNPEMIRSWTPLNGVTSNQTVVGMDFRPSNKALYIMGYDSAASTFQLYTVDTATGMATVVNASAVSLELDSAFAGFDFNPVTDQIRVTDRSGSSWVIDPANGSVVSQDSSLTYVSGDPNEGTDPYIVSIAHTNSYENATETDWFGYDENQNTFVSVVAFAEGLCQTEFQSGLISGMSDRTSDMDAYYDVLTNDDIFFFIANTDPSTDDFLYIVDEDTFEPQGRIGYGIPVKDIAVPVGEAPAGASIDYLEVAYEVSVYPNPASEQIFIKAENMDGQSFFVMDNLGRTVKAAQNMNGNITTISLDDMQSGVYFVRFENGRTLRFVVKK